jgi:transposase
MSMRNVREIVRQKWLLGRTHRAIAESVGVSVGAVSQALARASAADLTWEAVQAVDDEELERRLYPSVKAAMDRPEPDCVWIHRERHRPSVTLELLHHEYLERHPNGLQYTSFCDRYREWLGRRGLVMRQVHVAGDKAFVDYSGKKAQIVDAATGEVVDVELFVAVLGASNFTYAEATYTQRGPDWIASHVRALEYFGGVPAALVPDQLKSGVTRACLYEPEVQRTYEELAQHYGTTVLPARPARPRDKAMRTRKARDMAEIIAQVRTSRHAPIRGLSTSARAPGAEPTSPATTPSLRADSRRRRANCLFDDHYSPLTVLPVGDAPVLGEPCSNPAARIHPRPRERPHAPPKDLPCRPGPRIPDALASDA